MWRVLSPINPSVLAPRPVWGPRCGRLVKAASWRGRDWAGEKAAQIGATRMKVIQSRFAHYHFNSWNSSTLMVDLARYKAMTMASPTATSAAATVRAKNTKTWPLTL